MELECKKDELREMIDMIESEETANRVGKYLKRMLTREQPPCQYTIEELKELWKSQRRISGWGGIIRQKK